jgi:hypothetical protein
VRPSRPERQGPGQPWPGPLRDGDDGRRHGPGMRRAVATDIAAAAECDQSAGARKVTIKQPLLGPALAVSSHLPGIGIGIADG